MTDHALKKSKETISFTTHPSFIERIQSGNENAWHEFHKKYAGMIYNIGKKHNLTPEECNELLVDVMVIFWKKVDNFIYTPSPGRFRSYLTKISGFAALKIFHRSRKEKNIVNSAIEYPAEIDTKYMDEWHNFILERALEDLEQTVDTETYQVFCMSFLQNRPIKEIAEITRKTPNNIYVIRSRCIKKLRNIIAAYRQFDESELLNHSTKKNSPSNPS